MLEIFKNIYLKLVNTNARPIFIYFSFCILMHPFPEIKKNFFWCRKKKTINTITKNSPRTIGFALCFYIYSTWEGKSLFLEDLFVKSNHRTRGVGRQLFTEVVRHAQNNNCCRVDFHVLNWNPATEFYKKMKATNITEQEGWQLYRLNRNEFANLLN